MTIIEIATLLTAALSLGLSTWLHLEAKRKQRDQQSRWMRRQQSLESEVGKLRGTIAELDSRLDSPNQSLQAATTAPDSLNLNRRTQAMRLFRRGERPEAVAEQLSMPRQEITLLYKVFRTIHTKEEPDGGNQPSALETMSRASV